MAGFFKYEKASGRDASRFADPEVEAAVCAGGARRPASSRGTATRREIRERLVYALVNRGAYLLEEGIALRPGDIDIVYVYGYGFPPHHGGPMWYADEVGRGARLRAH